jgi:hypothetical protein
MSSYKLSLNSVRSINRTIIAVNQMRKTGVAGDLPFRQNQKRQPGRKSYPIMVGKTTQEWTKTTGQIIQPLDPVTENPLGDPVSVLNLFATVASGKWVAFSKTAQDQAILLSAECD